MKAWTNLHLLSLLVLLHLASSHFSCLLKTFLASTIQQLSKEKSCCSLPRGLPRPRWLSGVNILWAALYNTGKDFLCTSTLNTAVTTFWLCGRQPVCECLLKIVVPGSSPPSQDCLNFISCFAIIHISGLATDGGVDNRSVTSHGGEENQSDRKLVATKTNKDVLGPERYWDIEYPLDFRP